MTELFNEYTDLAILNVKNDLEQDIRPSRRDTLDITAAANTIDSVRIIHLLRVLYRSGSIKTLNNRSPLSECLVARELS